MSNTTEDTGLIINYLATKASSSLTNPLGAGFARSLPPQEGVTLELQHALENGATWQIIKPNDGDPNTVNFKLQGAGNPADLYLGIGNLTDSGGSCELSSTPVAFTQKLIDVATDTYEFYYTPDNGSGPFYLTYNQNTAGTNVEVKPKNPSGTTQKWKYRTMTHR